MKTKIQKQREVIITRWKLVDKTICELEGPYECEACGGHIMLDVTYLDQVEDIVDCPYCKAEGKIPDLEV